jgi:ribonuclease HI
MQDSSSVVMAESAALTLATSLCRQMGLQRISFFTNNQLLVNCINGDYPSNPPNWRIKPYTQTIVASLQDSYKVIKISRHHNHMVHSLATRALHQVSIHNAPQQIICTNSSHMNQCPLLCALNIVTINSELVLTAVNFNEMLLVKKKVGSNRA